MASPMETFKKIPALSPFVEGYTAAKEAGKKVANSLKEDYQTFTKKTEPTSIPTKTIRKKAKEIEEAL